MSLKPDDNRSGPGRASFRVPVGISGRHTHLCRADLNTLLGKGYELTPVRDLSQPGQFVSQETVNVVGPNGVIDGVRILGPTRPASVVELMRSDLFTLGYETEVAAGERFPVKVIGTEGILAMPEAGIIARRHLHATPEDSARYGLKDG